MSKKISFILLSVVFLFACTSEQPGKNDDPEVNQQKEESLTELNSQLADEPDNPDLYNKRAEELIDKGKVNEALADVRKALDIDSTKPEYYMTLGDAYRASGKFRKCRDALEKSIELDENNSEAHLKLAELFLLFKNYKQTLEHTRQALEIDDLDAKGYFIQGFAFLEMRDTAKSIKNFQRTLDIDPEYYEANLHLGDIFAQRENSLAVDYYNNALDIRPTDVQVMYALGMYYQNTGEYEQAIKHYNRIIENDPTFKFAPYNIGYIHLVYKEDFKTAISYFNDAIAIDPGYYEAYFNLGYSHELMGNYTKAIEYYEKSLEHQTNYPKAIEGLNRIHGQAGQ